jgi:hypothetical protein
MEDVEATAASGGEAVVEAPVAGRRTGWVVVGLVVVAAVPVIVGLIALRSPHWYPAGDMAQAELHVRGFWSHPPLVGAAGRLGTLQDQGSHPGPALWLAMYPVYALFGRSSYGLLAGAASVHLVAIALSLWVAWRRAGLAFTVVLGVAIAVLVRASGPAFFVEPWNPWLAVFPFLLFLLLLWAVLEEERSHLPLAVLAGTYCIHCHIGYLPIVGALVLGVLVWTGWTLHRHGEAVWRTLARPLAWSGVALVVMWLPPVVDQLIHDPGNLLILYRNFRYPADPAVGLVDAVRGFAGEVNLAGPWIVGRGHLPTDSPNVLGFAALLALWAAGAFVAVRQRFSDLVRLHALLAGTCVVGVLAIARITGTMFDYLLRWLWVVTALIVTASVTTFLRWWAAARAARGAKADRDGWRVAVVGIGAAVVLSAVAVPKFAAADVPGPRDSVIIGDLVRGARDQLDKGDRYLVRWSDPTALGATGFGTLLELARQGYHVGVDRPQRAGALPFRVLDESDADGVLYVIIGKDVDRWLARDDAVELASAEPRTPAEQAEGEALRERIIARLEEIGRSDLVPAVDRLYAAILFAPELPGDIKRDMSRLTDLRLPGALFLTAPGAPSEPPPLP